jgi:hypothetical protein
MILNMRTLLNTTLQNNRKVEQEGTAQPAPNRASQQGAEHAQQYLKGDFSYVL